MNKPKLYIFAHYYLDFASTAQLLKEQAEAMINEFDITVIAVVPSYSGKIDEKYKDKKFYTETLNGVKLVLVRVPEFDKKNKISRVKNIVSYFFGALKAFKKLPAPEYILTISQPPILGGYLGRCAKRNSKSSKLIYVIQDFNPEQTIATAYSKNKIITNIMMAFDKKSCRKSDLVITVGRDLIETLKNRFNDKNVPNYTLINNWTDEKSVYPLEKDNEKVLEFKNKYNLNDKFVFMYSGNIGLYYDLENIIKVIAKFKNEKDVAFAFIGDGTYKKTLEKYVEENELSNVSFIPYQHKEDLIFSLNSADVHFCVNSKGIKGVSCPSKFYGIAAAGKPVLAVLEDGSEIRLIIEETQCGLVSAPEEYEKIEENIRFFIDNKKSNVLKEMGERGRDYLVHNLTKDISIKKYIDAIKNL